MKSPTSPASTIVTAAALSSPEAAFAQPALGRILRHVPASGSVSHRLIADYLLRNQMRVTALGIEELAESCQVSSATISRFSIKFIQECFPMHIEKRVYIAVPPMVVEQIWSEVDRWHLWDPDTRQARLNGPFAVGARGRITPSKGMGVPMIITERTEGRSFTVEGYIPLFRMHFEHTVAPADGGSEVVHRVWFTGALAFLFGPGVARQLREGLPRTMQSLKSYAEQRHKPFNSGA